MKEGVRDGDGQLVAVGCKELPLVAAETLGFDLPSSGAETFP